MSKLEHKVPTFAEGTIVRKEIMQCVRDMALDEQNIRYYKYADGVIAGCTLVEENMKVGLINGMVKFAGHIYKLTTKAFVSYEPTDSLTILKLRFSPQITSKEYTHYTAELVLDTDATIKPHEMEMGRFKLKRGSRLRTDYKDFWDMATEYDTVNLIHVPQSACDKPTLSPAITRLFAQEAYNYLADNTLDSAFCTNALSGETLNRELIERYICNRLKQDYTGTMNNSKLHASLGEVLRIITRRSGLNKGRGRNGDVVVLN